MGWTKADRKKFLDAMEQNRPTSAVKQMNSLFGDIIENDSKSNLQSIQLIIKYPVMTQNLNGDPMPKQSARFMVSRYNSGQNKGEPVIYTNKRTGKKDVIIKSYQEAKITNTVDMIRKQVYAQLKKMNFTKFRGAIFITKMEFIFQVSKNAPKYMINDLKAGTKIYFKDTRPDLDNLEKLILDALETEKMEKDSIEAMKGLVYDNDAQIVAKTSVFKRWGIVPGVIINMEGLI